MELKEKACEEILNNALETFDAVQKEQGGIEDWRSVFEAAFQCLLTLKDTEAIQLFVCMCICSLDFEAYSNLEDAFINHEKLIFAENTYRYMQLNGDIEEPKNSEES